MQPMVHFDIARQSTLLAVQDQLNGLAGQLAPLGDQLAKLGQIDKLGQIATKQEILLLTQAIADLTEKIGILVTQDASVAATAQDLLAAAATENLTLTALQSIVAALQQQVAAGGTPLSQQTMDALAAAQSAVDQATAAGTAQVAADQPPNPPVTGQ